MADLWFVLVIVAFFGLCVGFVWGCDKIIGPDETEALDLADAASVDAPVADGAAR
jgi:hypothetical protein